MPSTLSADLRERVVVAIEAEPQAGKPPDGLRSARQRRALARSLRAASRSRSCRRRVSSLR